MINHQAKTITSELVLHALGKKLPENYAPEVSKDLLTEAGLESIPAPTGPRSKGDILALGRRLAYYKILRELRMEDCQFVGLAMVARTETAFAKYVGEATWDHVLQWASFFKPMADLIESRALGDWSGRAELAKIFGEDGANVPAVVDWHNYNSSWNTIDDQEQFQHMHPQMDLGPLPQAEVQLERGFEGITDENAACSLWPRWDDNELVVCASVPIKAPSFVGILPGTMMFDIDREPASGMYHGPEPGLFMDPSNRVGLLSHIQRTRDYAEGNVISAWEPYADEDVPDQICMHLVVFAYRPVEPAQPLVLWEHLAVE
ncbi:hypothetical protein M436DRAFT_43677 [Aureobasidium namibiae CBS 147.97]|uniref:Uncharacterized protein n=1 Tax=Aureobasidium namibiae CBS 147.97 TaxID=1043004 RepID=A0A074WM57_9PEZI|nr:uncharacterized protein M436DRAFT_43677 [Aureobasidium namibiae CBS 147.97]KEQ74185.1 hypothetical protein M436DRAFT_43677 [Aureobasidium namibiae CBS 147.97]